MHRGAGAPAARSDDKLGRVRRGEGVGEQEADGVGRGEVAVAAVLALLVVAVVAALVAGVS